VIAPRRDVWKLQYGARFQAGVGVTFRVWAPRLETLCVSLSGTEPRTVPMTRDGEDFHTVVPHLEAGVDYAFVTSSGNRYPDPVSRWQPFGVHGASRVVDPDSFSWTDEHWKGIALEDLVIYELHTGTFTREGTFEAIVPKLSYLRQLGITAIELMPIAEFPGARNWGYDGVSLYAPHSKYGGPLGLKKLVDACHREGLAVVLDVVYNHLGPEGNYLSVFAPFFTQSYRTPWGEALNFDGPDSDNVRRFFIDNALYWISECHIDALRLDAVHGIFDFGARHILEELTTSVHDHALLLGRKVHLIAESDLNDIRVVKPVSEGGYGLDAQWLDEFHHSLRTMLIEPRIGYLGDYGRLEYLSKAITEGFVHDGSYSRHRRKHYGSSSKKLPGRQFVVFIQNHDQIANASQGERLSKLVTAEQQKLAAAVLLCSPYVPLLFMGQEYGETAPFHFFTSFDDPALVEAVREGRRKEFAAFAGDRHFADPQDPATFEHARLDWTRLQKAPHSAILRLYRDLIALRKNLPCLANCRKDLTRITFSEESKWMVLERADPAPSLALLVCNFAGCEQSVPVDFGERTWFLKVWTGAEAYGGAESQNALPATAGENVSNVILAASQAALYTTPN
jgi:maltooligosyltrehalose trehalohydrolase